MKVEVRVNAVVLLVQNSYLKLSCRSAGSRWEARCHFASRGAHGNLGGSETIGFSRICYGVTRESGGETMPAMEEITKRRSAELGRHRNDTVIE
jgi:hypothetical protein